MKKLILACALMIAFVSTAPVGAVDVNNFRIENFTIDYYLSRDTEGRATLKTTEHIQALFPDSDQNHGLERAISLSYDGHPTDLKITSITNEAGSPLAYTQNEHDGYLIMRIGEADRYVHGLQHYVITYTQRDVTKLYRDTRRDEFYWDTNGVEWAVPIASLDVRVHIDEDIAGRLTSEGRAYVGKAGANTETQVVKERSSNIWRVHARDLQPRENVTVAFGFMPGTFAAYREPLLKRIFAAWVIAQALIVPIAVCLLVWMVMRYYRWSSRSAEIGTIVPEYLPPPDTSVSVAGSILGRPGKVFSAQLIDFAVRHYVRIYQTREKSFFRGANYEIEIVKDISSLKKEEQEVIRDLFDNPVRGARLDMATLRRDTKTIIKLSDNKKKIDTSIAQDYRLRTANEAQSRWFRRLGVLILIAGLLSLSPILLIIATISFVSAVTLKPLTDAGLVLARYLKGLEMYIGVAEAERLRILQSPEGAERRKVVVNTNDTREMIVLYERLLPYAIVFGKEKQWNAQLGQYYQSIHESPEWFVGTQPGFNALVFASAVDSFSTVASYSDPTNASSGGSAGGGSSGGGGGGGGGGGW